MILNLFSIHPFLFMNSGLSSNSSLSSISGSTNSSSSYSSLKLTSVVISLGVILNLSSIHPFLLMNSGLSGGGNLTLSISLSYLAYSQVWSKLRHIAFIVIGHGLGGVGLNSGGAGVSGMFNSMVLVFHLSLLFVYSSESPFLNILRTSLVGGNSFNNVSLINSLLSKDFQVLIFSVLVGGLLERAYMSSPGGISRGLLIGYFLTKYNSGFLKLFLGLVFKSDSSGAGEVVNLSNLLSLHLTGADIGGFNTNLGQDLSQSSVLMLQTVHILFQMSNFISGVHVNYLGVLDYSGLAFQLDVIGP